MMGRLMSLVMIAGMGLVPVSQALAGFLLKVSFEGVFAVCGILIVLIAYYPPCQGSPGLRAGCIVRQTRISGQS